MPETKTTFGSLTLHKDTIVRLDSRDNEARPQKDTKGQCPATTQSKVTAHCC